MASILKIGTSWRAQIRRKGHKPITETFPTKAAATTWARQVEAEIDARRYVDARGLDSVLLGDLLDRYIREIGEEKPFGRNKHWVLSFMKRRYGDKAVSEITDELLIQHIKDRRKDGIAGSTIAGELTYLASVFRAAKELWKMPVSLAPFQNASAGMRHMKIQAASAERTRRPTADEIIRLCDYFDRHSDLPMRDIIHFAIDTAMRLSEILSLRWRDLNKADKTIIIRDRKHPLQKQGNDMEVPLLGNAFVIVQWQPVTDSGLIFPYKANTISSIFGRACAALGIVDLHFHDLRHEGVSRLFEQGYSIEQVALVSGHRDWKMLARYTQIRAKDLHRTT